MLRIAIPTCLILVFATSHPASAETLNRSLSGKRLELRMDCPAHIEIQPRSDLVDKIEVEAEADDQATLDALHLSGSDVAAIVHGARCGSADDDSLELTLHVPPGLPIDIGEASAGEYEIGAVGGPLKMKLSGAVELHAERLSSLDLDSAGAAEISIDRLDGPGVVALRGGGELTIADGTMPSLKLDSRGAGEFQVESGEIGTLTISLAGAGDAQIRAPVRDATLEILGVGNIDIDKVTGQVSRKILGLGNIDIGS
jgi:Putative auto-transporter adhesin, head GIN domain